MVWNRNPEGENVSKARVVIKKYSDRRLYDTAASSYVKLDDIARMIRDGMEVEVRDARTGKDLTSVILTQIVMEDAREGEGGLPLHFLRQLVIASDRATREFQSRLSDARLAVTNPVEFLRNLLGRDEEVARLQRRVGELEQRLAQLTAPRRKPRRKRQA
jgi:polyhydroxyalkanoate synthesis repressor PhaR